MMLCGLMCREDAAACLGEKLVFATRTDVCSGESIDAFAEIARKCGGDQVATRRQGFRP